MAASRFLTESRAEGNTKYDRPGAVTSTAGLVSLVYGFTKAAGDDWDSGVTIAFLVAAVVLLAAFVLIWIQACTYESSMNHEVDCGVYKSTTA